MFDPRMSISSGPWWCRLGPKSDRRPLEVGVWWRCWDWAPRRVSDRVGVGDSEALRAPARVLGPEDRCRFLELFWGQRVGL